MTSQSAKRRPAKVQVAQSDATSHKVCDTSRTQRRRGEADAACCESKASGALIVAIQRLHTVAHTDVPPLKPNPCPKIP